MDAGFPSSPAASRPVDPARPGFNARALAGLDIDWELNGAEFQAQFHYHVLDRGIGHAYMKPATPRLNGKIERSHGIDAEEFYRMLEGVVIDDTELFNDRLQQWETFYNFNRPHGGLGGSDTL